MEIKLNKPWSELSGTERKELSDKWDAIIAKRKEGKKFSHAMDVGFEVCSNNGDTPTREEIIVGLSERLQYLIEHPDEILEACDSFDMHEID